MKSRMIVLTAVCTLLLWGCLAFYSAHEQFRRGMDTYVKMNRTIDFFNDQEYPAYRPANFEHLTNIERIDELIDRYHFRRPSLWGFCYYYFDVDRASRKVIGWGFDEHLADPKETCGMSG